MPKKISELDSVNSATPDDLLELAVVDGGSPTGYSSRSIRVEDLPSSGGLPYRYPLDLDVEFDPYDNSFQIVIDRANAQSLAESLQIDNGFGPLLVSADFNLIVLGRPDSESPFTIPAFGNFKVMLSWSGWFEGKKYVFNHDSAELNSQLMSSIVDNTLTYTPQVVPMDANQYGDSFGVKIVWKPDYNNVYPIPTRALVKGYIDIVSILYNAG